MNFFRRQSNVDRSSFSDLNRADVGIEVSGRTRFLRQRTGQARQAASNARPVRGTLAMSNPESIAELPELEQLFRDSAGDLERYFQRRHGTLEDARDLVQEVFLQLARSPARPRGSARGYLFGIARNLSAGWWRKRSRRPRHESLEDFPAAGAVNRSQADERLEQARELLAELPARDREILEFRLGMGLSYAETAEALGIPVGTVRSRLHHAMAVLRARLESENHQ